MNVITMLIILAASPLLQAQIGSEKCHSSAPLRMPVMGELQDVIVRLAFTIQPGGRKLLVLDTNKKTLSASSIICTPAPIRRCRLEDDGGEFVLRPEGTGFELITAKSALQVGFNEDDESLAEISLYPQASDQTYNLQSSCK